MTARSALFASVLCGWALLAGTPASAATIRIDEAFALRSSWDMASDDAYLATRAGVMESLTRIDFDNRLQPSLAVSWAQTGPLVWRFTLRKGVKFHDGTPLDAQTATNALQQLLKATVPARAFSPKLIKSVEAVGEDVVQITTVNPMVLLPSIVAAPATSILSPSAYKEGRVDPAGAGTGPFVLKEADPSRGLKLVRNDAYWGGKPTLDGAEIRFIADAAVRATQVRTQEVDLARTIAPVMVTQLESTPGIVVVKLAAPRDSELLLNNKRAPFDNLQLRQAIKAAIDTAGLNAAVYEGAMVPATGVFVATDPWAAPEPKPAFDPAAAKALLQQAGIKPGTLKLGLLAYTSKTEFKNVAEVIQSLLGEIGIQVDVRLAEYNAIEPAMLSGNFDMALMSRGYLTDGGEPGGFLNADYGCTGTFNMSHHCDPAVDAKLKEAAETPDPQRRYAIYKDVARQLQAQAVTVFLVNESTFDAVSARVKHYRPHPLNYYMLVPELSLE